uniref:Uncharacterized protein n=1 Tax=Rhizophora mucronata TaxID=61149 RepID=A0A2P2PLL3_RHIMU
MLNKLVLLKFCLQLLISCDTTEIQFCMLPSYIPSPVMQWIIWHEHTKQ